MTVPIRPPAHVEPYVNILGQERALAFFFAFGGAELYIPRNPKASSQLVQLLGREHADALAAAGPRLPKRVPMPKKYLAQVLFQQGLTVAHMARKLHVSDTTVRAYLKNRSKRPPPDIQPDLFK